LARKLLFSSAPSAFSYAGTTAINEHDLNQLNNLLHGDEEFVSARCGYRGAEKRDELKDRDVDWFIAERPGKSGY
jgi:IS5 family transposase